jgi:pimeloyl-ACP methyl ester carboxylesterase
VRKPDIIIYLPGLGDRNPAQRRLVKLFALGGADTRYFTINWADRGEPYAHKFKRLLKLVDQLAKTRRVSLIGVSAGASLAINTLSARPEQIHRVVTVCGKLANINAINPSYYHENPAFKGSVGALYKSLKQLSGRQRQKVLCLRPLLDEVVPTGDMHINGAHRKTLPLIGHAPTIALSLTLFSGSIKKFIGGGSS